MLKAEFATTLTRALSRLIGTAIGLVFGTLLLYFVFDQTWERIALFAIVVFLIFSFGSTNYVLLMMFPTGMLVMLLSFLGMSPEATISERALDTVIGGGIALLCFAGWSVLFASKPGADDDAGSETGHAHA